MNEAQVTFYFEPRYTIGAKKHVATIRSVADLINHNLYQRMLTGDVKIYDVEMCPFKSEGCLFKESIYNLIKVISWYKARPKATYGSYHPLNNIND
tara:strand:- start:570 stop:857 length:288 start_codon:yes stop_codon:yes gene_type:complete